MRQSISKPELRLSGLRAQENDLKASSYGSLFKSIKSSPGMSQYLRPAARNRARLRLGRSRLNAVLFRSLALRSPKCVECSAASENVAHVLFDCPAYGVARAICRSALAASAVSFSLDRVLGNVDGLSAAAAGSTLLATSTFIKLSPNLASSDHAVFLTSSLLLRRSRVYLLLPVCNVPSSSGASRGSRLVWSGSVCDVSLWVRR